MGHRILVLSVFKDEAAADSVAQLVKDSGLARHDAIGVLVLDKDRQVKTDKIGRRTGKKGAGIGLALAMFTPVGLAVGVFGGGLLGALHHKGLGLDDADRERIGAALHDGKAAVGVLARVREADALSSMLTDLGGVTESHLVDKADLVEAGEAATTDAPS